ncbi:MAG: Methionine sulfoxide reductase [Clostridia bacterium]|jgi:peptide-methionine (S)-S-oxide reductase|nr:Methionine sulfoxide reductase [Clostridia bacterium]
MDYNPEEITYEELLQIFFDNHSPEYNVSARQYISVIFYQDEKQLEAATKALIQTQEKRGEKIYTQILPYEKIYIAETYHQKYYMQRVDLLKNDIKKHYPKFKDFVDSTAAARINGYVKGLGTMNQLMGEIDKLGLSDKGKKRLIEIVDSY